MIHLFKRVYIDYIDNFYNINKEDVYVISERWDQGHLRGPNVIGFYNGSLSDWLNLIGLDEDFFYEILTRKNQRVIIYLDEPDLMRFAARHYRRIMPSLDPEGLRWILGNFQDEQRARNYGKFSRKPLCRPDDFVDLEKLVANSYLIDEPFSAGGELPLIAYSIEWLLLRKFIKNDPEVNEAVRIKTFQFCDEVMVNTIKRIKERILREGTEMGRILEGRPWKAGTLFDNLNRFPAYTELLNCRGLKTAAEIFDTISLEHIAETAYAGHNVCFTLMSSDTRDKMDNVSLMVEDYEIAVAELKMELDYKTIPKAIKEGDLETLMKLNIFAGQPMTYARGSNKEEVSFAIINSIIRAKRMEELKRFENLLIG